MFCVTKKTAIKILLSISSEIIRVIESLQLTEKYKVATPVDWKVGLIRFNFS